VSAALGFDSIGKKFSPSNIFGTMKCVSDRVFGKTDVSCFDVASGRDSFSSSSSNNSGVPIFGGTRRDPGGNSPNGV
jgi:hypothetical protein